MFEKPVVARWISRRGMLAAAGKPVELLEVSNYAHLEMAESLGNPYGLNGDAALALMRLGMG